MNKINVLIVTLFFLSTSCHKDSSSKGCGCGSVVYDTVKNVKGTLSWTQKENNKEWTLDGVGLLSPSMQFGCTVCNSNAIDDLIDIDDSNQIPVIFSGELYNICDNGGIKPANATSYFFIKIDSLKKDLP